MPWTILDVVGVVCDGSFVMLDMVLVWMGKVVVQHVHFLFLYVFAQNCHGVMMMASALTCCSKLRKRPKLKLVRSDVMEILMTVTFFQRQRCGWVWGDLTRTAIDWQKGGEKEIFGTDGEEIER